MSLFSVLSTSAVANRFVYVGSNDQSLYAFNQVHTKESQHELQN